MRYKLLSNHVNSSPLVPHIYVSVNQVSIGSDNGLSPTRRQAIIWISAGLLSIGSLGSKVLIHENASKNIVCERQPFCPGGDELRLALGDINGEGPDGGITKTMRYTLYFKYNIHVKQAFIQLLKGEEKQRRMSFQIMKVMECFYVIISVYYTMLMVLHVYWLSLIFFPKIKPVNWKLIATKSVSACLKVQYQTEDPFHFSRTEILFLSKQLISNIISIISLQKMITWNWNALVTLGAIYKMHR